MFSREPDNEKKIQNYVTFLTYRKASARPCDVSNVTGAQL